MLHCVCEIKYIIKFLRMNSEGITERVRPCPRERRLNQCVWVVKGVDVKHVEGYNGLI